GVAGAGPAGAAEPVRVARRGPQGPGLRHRQRGGRRGGADPAAAGGGARGHRPRSRFGRRRVWMAAGVVVLALSLVAIGPQRSWVGVMICWMFASLGFSIASAGLFAAVADQVPVTQRGIISGAIFGPQALGLLVGLALLAEVITGTASGYLVLAVAVVILSVPFVLRYRDSPA